MHRDWEIGVTYTIKARQALCHENYWVAVFWFARPRWDLCFRVYLSEAWLLQNMILIDQKFCFSNENKLYVLIPGVYDQ